MQTIKGLERIKMETDDCFVYVYKASAVDYLVYRLKYQLFMERSRRARTTQLLLRNAIDQLESKYKHKFDNMRVEFHIWGVVKRKCKKYAKKFDPRKLKESR